MVRTWMACVVAALALSGCGGSGGGGVEPTPPPPTLTPITQGVAPAALAPITSGTLADGLKGKAEFRTGSTEVTYDVAKQTVSSRNKLAVEGVDLDARIADNRRAHDRIDL